MEEHAKEMASEFVAEFGKAWADSDGDWDTTAFESAPRGSDFASWKALFVAETERLMSSW